jgi:hypothetical protein
LRALGTQDAGGSPRAAASASGESGTFPHPLIADLPAGIRDLCSQVGDIPGVELAGLLAALSPDADAAEQVYAQLVTAVREAARQGDGASDATV